MHEPIDPAGDPSGAGRADPTDPTTEPEVSRPPEGAALDEAASDATEAGRAGGRRSGGVRLTDDTVQQQLQHFATEFLVWVTPTGELAGATEFNTLGYDSDERAGRHIAELIHPDDLPRVFDIIERARVTTGFEESVLARARHKDGSWHLFDAKVYDAHLRSDLHGAVLRVRDVTEEHNARVNEESDDGVSRFLSLAEMLPQGILSADARGWVAFCNDAAQQIFDLPADLVLGHGWERAVHEEDRPDVADAMGQVVRTGETQQVVFRIVAGQATRWAHAKFVPLVARDTVTGWIATVEDITERRAAESELAHQATHDALTGLPNRTLLEDRLAQARGRLRRDSTSITVVFVDLDEFKEVNDTLGHRAGDQVLAEVAQRLRHIMRDVDTVARLGGDEFVALCESLPAEEAATVVQRIHDALTVPLLVEGTSVQVGASIGVAATSDPACDMTDLLAMADQSMYREKADRKKLEG